MLWQSKALDKRALRLEILLDGLHGAGSFDEECEWLEDAASWAARSGDGTHLTMLLDALEKDERHRERLRALVSHVFTDTNAVRLFTDTGLPSQHGFFAEALDRLMKNLLPAPPIERDAALLLARLFPSRRVAAWFEQLDDALCERLFALLEDDGDRRRDYIARAIHEAARLLAIRTAANGSSDELRERTLAISVDESSFVRLPRAIRLALTGELPPDDARAVIEACRQELANVVAALDQTGISVNLVYRLDVIRMQLSRLETLLTLILGGAAHAAVSGLSLLRALVWGGVRDRSLSVHLSSGSQLLAQRIIERAGHTGDHYITRTRKEQHEMVTSAGGGGAITGIAVLTKFFIGWSHLPVLFESLAIFINYAAAFIAMQLGHFTLATKQPAMTAATIAGAIKNQTAGTERDLEPLAELVERTVRSQIAAFVGNLGIVIPMCLALDLIWFLIFHHHVLDAKYADKIVAAHHPWRSGTLFFAAATGVCLWLSSILGGAIENWFVLRKLPAAISANRLVRALLGRARAARLGQFWSNNISGFGGNLSFGLLLGFGPMMAMLVGIPLEVRHITFVTGQLVYAGMERGAEGVLRADYLWALSSIVLVGAINFTVSFTLALGVAFRAREVRARDQLALVGAIWRRFKAQPWSFLSAP